MLMNNISTSGGLNHLYKLFQDGTDLAEGKKDWLHILLKLPQALISTN